MFPKRNLPVFLSAVARCRPYHHQTGVFGYRPAHIVAATALSVPEQVLRNRAAQSNIYRLVSAYREFGHRIAQLDPLTEINPFTDHAPSSAAKYDNYTLGPVPELDLSYYDLEGQVNDEYSTEGIINMGHPTATLNEILQFLRRTYCSTIAAEFMQLEESSEREWFAQRLENVLNRQLEPDDQRTLLTELGKAQLFENFLAAKFPTVKRYSGEGAESMMAFFIQLFNKASEYKLDEIVVCMPHRGRLTLLAGLFKYPVVNMFRKMKGLPEFPDGVSATGDVVSHLFQSLDLNCAGHNLHVVLLPNPSHLEAVNPVAVGKARGKHMTLRTGDYSSGQEKSFMGDRVLCVQVHGDASLVGQGITMETLALSQVPNYNVGGSVHLIVNNQLGYTTPREHMRSSRYCSDLAKMIPVPVIHVNGDNPEDLYKATILAMEYRQRFRKDVFIDLVCFRRWGHNELDDPTFTNPVMYHAIHSRRSVPDLYAEKLQQSGMLTKGDVERFSREYTASLNESLAKVDSHHPPATHLQKLWKGLVPASSTVTTWDTGMPLDVLKYVGQKSVAVPDQFHIHPHLQKMFVQARISKITNGEKIDWSCAEALAFGSLLYQGFDIRLSGQDVGRGTFSQRHAMLIDQDNGDVVIPLNHLLPNQRGFFEVANSILSEEAVLGYEYGVSLENPNRLTLWEAQFGDFFNGAQIIIDTFITSGETKWLLQSGLVLLLPHGYDGAGPEHTSCRMERFLQMTDSKEDGIDGDNVNINVINPTTPAQYFHALRRQLIRNFRKPLIVVAPKILLRLPEATSKLSDMAPGSHFLPVIADDEVSPENVKHVVFCSGKHYYNLMKHRAANQFNTTAIVRVESLCPFPVEQLQQQLKRYPKAADFTWSQEEQQNMGAWSFVAPRFTNLVGCQLRYAGRPPLATPAVGVAQVHREESQAILNQTFNR